MSTGASFSDAHVWSGVLLLAVVLGSLLLANIIKNAIPGFRKSLLPVSVLGGIILLVISSIVKGATGEYLFNLPAFCADTSVTGIETLEIITYHCLAIGFIAMTLRKSSRKLNKQRAEEVFNTGLITVNTYLIQAVVGLIITIISSFLLPKLLKASGILLAFGYGQGTGQALNYGAIYEGYNWEGGKSFGLAVAAMGFLSASIFGVVHLNIQKKRGKIVVNGDKNALNREKVEDEGEIPMIESIDKITVQISMVGVIYAVTCILLKLLGGLVGDGLRSTIYGFNFLFGVLVTVIFKAALNFMRKRNIVKRDYINNFLLNRIGGFAFDIMIVAGIGAIQIHLIKDYWLVLLIIGVAGAVITFLYDHFACFKLFPGYADEQFMAMFGMLTGTASTGVILLREIDPEFQTPVSENLVYQNFPAIVFGFPIMLIASFAPQSDTNTYIALGVIAAIFVVLNLLLFRKRIFSRRVKAK